nr:hypothetical protein [Tanacetum cinerariifolium]
DDIPLTIKDDNLREKLLNVDLLIATIEALNDNPTPSSDCKTKSSSTSLDSLLEETSTFHNSLPEFENFFFDLGEISSGSTTTHCDISLPDYEAFYFDDNHIKEISSGSPTAHSDISLSEYDSFIFKEFVYELAHIISPPEYDRFYFKDLLDPGELMSVLNSGIRENLLSTTLVNLPIEDDHSPLLAYVIMMKLLLNIKRSAAKDTRKAIMHDFKSLKKIKKKERLFNEKYASTIPGFDDLILWGDIKIFFELDGDNEVWKNHHSQELIERKLYDSCEVHSLML